MDVCLLSTETYVLPGTETWQYCNHSTDMIPAERVVSGCERCKTYTKQIRQLPKYAEDKILNNVFRYSFESFRERVFMAGNLMEVIHNQLPGDQFLI